MFTQMFLQRHTNTEVRYRPRTIYIFTRNPYVSTKLWWGIPSGMADFHQLNKYNVYICVVSGDKTSIREEETSQDQPMPGRA